MELTGKWKSEKYMNIFGTITFTLNDLKSLFTCEMRLDYDKYSSYKPGQTATIMLEGVYKAPDTNSYNKDGHRIMFRKKNFVIDQYFSITIYSNDKVNWTGYLTSINPVDIVVLFDIVSKEIQNTGDKTDYVDENKNLGITI